MTVIASVDTPDPKLHSSVKEQSLGRDQVHPEGINPLAACALRVIDGEMRGIAALKDIILSTDFERLIHAVLECKGKFIACGVGKSGHIARKISATLASTGTSSFFVHPAEASHGDMGMISQQDIVLLLSNSGETRELEDVIGYCKRFSIPIVGVVRRRGSMLATAADYPFILPEVPEVTSVNAPTTSTTMMLVWGDALAASLIEARGFNKEDFGVLHPGGSLGGSMKSVKTVMVPKDRCSIVCPNTDLTSVILSMTTLGQSLCVVANEKEEIKGIVTGAGLQAFLDKGISSTGLKASDIMLPFTNYIGPDVQAAEAAKKMQSLGVAALPISSDGITLEGVLHISALEMLGMSVL